MDWPLDQDGPAPRLPSARGGISEVAIVEKGPEADDMKQFSATELANATGDVLAAAAQAPVLIARHGKPRFVVLSTDEYERLRSHGDSRRAFHLADLTDAEADKLIADLQDSIDNGGPGRPGGRRRLALILGLKPLRAVNDQESGE
jgi:prevent-host-death family protein